jgi:hypothetical protein
LNRGLKTLDFQLEAKMLAMFKKRSRSCIGFAVAGALFAAQAGAMTPQADSSVSSEGISPQQQIIVFDPDTSFTMRPSEVISLSEPDGSVAFYELAPVTLSYDVVLDDAYVAPYGAAASDQITVINPDGSNWSYVPVDLSTWYGPFDAALTTDEAPAATIYVAELQSLPEYWVSVQE